MKYDSSKRRPNLFRRPRRAPALPISLIVIAAVILLFSLIPPSLLTPEIVQPLGIKVPTVTPSPTPLPLPTDIHGGRVVFTCTRGDYNQICMINADGTDFRQLTNTVNNNYYPALSPDSKFVVYASNQYDNFDLYLLNLGNSNFTQLTSSLGNSFSPDFSRDGKQILFVNKTADGKSALWVMGSRGENPRPIYTGPSNIVGAAWSPDGKAIAFAMSVNLQFAYEIFLLDLQNLNAAPRQLSRDLEGIGGSIDWSPDGKNLLIFAGPVAAREIYRLDVDTGSATQLTFGGNNAAASYSPDGQWIVYNSLRKDNQADLYIMQFNGHTTRQLTDFPEPDWQPQWGP